MSVLMCVRNKREASERANEEWAGERAGDVEANGKEMKFEANEYESSIVMAQMEDDGERKKDVANMEIKKNVRCRLKTK